MLALTPEQSYLRAQCGLPPTCRAHLVIADPDDPECRELTTAQAAAAAHVSEATIRDWARASRALIHSVAGPGEAPRYLEIEVLEAERATRRTARMRRLAQEAAQDSESPNSSSA